VPAVHRNTVVVTDQHAALPLRKSRTRISECRQDPGCSDEVCWIQNGLSIHPDVNMISNIGFDDRATHIKKPNRFANLAAHDIEFPLRHPATMICNSTADHFIQRTVFTPSTASNKASGQR